MQACPAGALFVEQAFQGRAGFLCQGDHDIAVTGFRGFADHRQVPVTFVSVDHGIPAGPEDAKLASFKDADRKGDVFLHI